MREKKIVANNKKARFDFFIEDIFEAGIVLTGTEIKSIRQGKVSINESYAKVRDGEIFILGMNISPYEQGNIFNVDPLRERKLLLSKREIRKIDEINRLKGKTIIPLQVSTLTRLTSQTSMVLTTRHWRMLILVVTI